MIRTLYKASQAGVQIDLIVRSMCSLRPGIKGLSENIRVRSILGRFLEHSRIYYFHNNGQEEILMGSADLMTRNLSDRVEILFPLKEKALVKQVKETVLPKYLADNANVHEMQSDGTYDRPKTKKGKDNVLDVQSLFLLDGAAPQPAEEKQKTKAS
jgi:polyphosphate kinase